VVNERAYSQFAPGLDFIGQGDFKRGDFLFRGVHPGLGPLFNARSCQSCHVRDGRGQPPQSATEPMVSMLLRFSIPGEAKHAGVVPEPTYGDQLQTFGGGDHHPTGALAVHDGALDGGPVIGEGFAFMDYQPVTGHYPDGTPYSLRQPVYKVRDLAYGPLHEAVRFSPRVTPPVFGLGLIEAIPQADILALADPDDADGDGISGRVIPVWDVLAQTFVPGRFGLKASQPSILQQLAGAYRGDLGVTNPLFPEEACSPVQTTCLAAAKEEVSRGTATEASALELALVEHYNRTLAVPPRRAADDPAVLQGKRIFFQVGCPDCHVPRQRTGELPGSRLGEISGLALTPDPPPVRAVSQQIIWPYTDLLLHDLGGECQPVRRETLSGGECPAGAECVWVQRCSGLADGRPDSGAAGSEWRTPPLWGIGLAKTVNPRAGFLHDGRARTLEEAILWHDGEARASRQRFMALEADERAWLLGFLESL